MMIAPTEPASRFRATPRTPLSNATISLAMMLGKPSMRAIASPTSITVPRKPDFPQI